MAFNIDRELIDRNTHTESLVTHRLTIITSDAVTASVITRRIAEAIDNLGDKAAVNWTHSTHTTSTFDNDDF